MLDKVICELASLRDFSRQTRPGAFPPVLGFIYADVYQVRMTGLMKQRFLSGYFE